MIHSRRLERRPKARSLFDRGIVVCAIGDAFKKLHPRYAVRNPVMFIVEIGALVTLFFCLRDTSLGARNAGFAIAGRFRTFPVTEVVRGI